MSESYFDIRLKRDPGQIKVWRAIIDDLEEKYLKSPIKNALDMGCGYGDFINQVRAETKYAIDLADMSQHLDPSIKFRQLGLNEIEAYRDENIDLIFSSNVLEHLEREEILEVLKKAFDLLEQGGQIVLLLPNFRFCYRRYFDDYTHKTILTDEAIQGMLQACGFKIQYSKPRYLPFTMQNSILPKTYILTRLYLKLGSPIMGAQMLTVAQKS